MTSILKNKYFQLSLAIITWISILYLITFKSLNNFQINLIYDNNFSNLLNGFKNTVILSLISLLLSMIIGIILYIMLQSKIYYIKYFANIFIKIMLGTPLIVLILIMVYVIGENILQIENLYVIGVITLSLYMAPYIANIYISAIESIDKEQFIVCKLYNFSTFQKYRYVIIPQISKRLMPPLMNSLSLIIKGSSLLAVVGVKEIYHTIGNIQSKTYAFNEGYIVMWMMFLIITIPLSILTSYIEKRFK